MAASERDAEGQPAELTPRQKVRRIFYGMMQECGPEIVRMPASIETYLSRYLIHYPNESKLLILATKLGYPQQLFAHEARHGYTQFLDSLIDEFATSQDLARRDAKWALDTWARGILKPRGYVHTEAEVDPRLIEREDPAKRQQLENFARVAMLFIVATGGFFGTFTAISLMPILIWAYGATPGGMVLMGAMEHERLEMWQFFLYAFISGAACGLIGSAAAVMGWLFGSGDAKPWTAASAASGSAFFSVFCLLFATYMCCVPLLVAPFIHFGAVFITTYRTAARGGNY